MSTTPLWLSVRGNFEAKANLTFNCEYYRQRQNLLFLLQTTFWSTWDHFTVLYKSLTNAMLDFTKAFTLRVQHVFTGFTLKTP